MLINNNTVYGDSAKYSGVYNVPNYKEGTNREMPRLVLIPDVLKRRMESHGLGIDDILNLDKVLPLLTPREIKLITSDIDYHYTELFAKLAKYLSDFQYVPITYLPDINLTNNARETIEKAVMKHSLEKIDIMEIKKFYVKGIDVGYMDKDNYGIELVQLTDKLYGLVIKSLGEQTFSDEEYEYMLCKVICDKLQSVIGLRKIAKTDAFSRIIALSKSSALLRHS